MTTKSVYDILSSAPSGREIPTGFQPAVVVDRADAPTTAEIASHLDCTTVYADRVRTRHDRAWAAAADTHLFTEKVFGSRLSNADRIFRATNDWLRAPSTEFADFEEAAAHMGITINGDPADGYLGDARIGGSNSDGNYFGGITTGNWNIGDVVAFGWCADQTVAADHIWFFDASKISLTHIASGEEVKRGWIISNASAWMGTGSGNVWAIHTGIGPLIHLFPWDTTNRLQTQTEFYEVFLNSLFGNREPRYLVNGQWCGPDQRVFGWPEDMCAVIESDRTHFFIDAPALDAGLTKLAEDAGEPRPDADQRAEIPSLVSLTMLHGEMDGPADFLVGTELEEYRNESDVLDHDLFPELEGDNTIRAVKKRIADLTGVRSFALAGEKGVFYWRTIALVDDGANLHWHRNGEYYCDVGDPLVADLVDDMTNGASFSEPNADATILASSYTSAVITAAEDDVDSLVAARGLPSSNANLDLAFTDGGFQWASTWGHTDMKPLRVMSASAIAATFGR